MKNRTSGGLVKFSAVLEEDAFILLDQLAAQRGPGTTRQDVIREALRLGLPLYEQQTKVLDSMRPKVGAVVA